MSPRLVESSIASATSEGGWQQLQLAKQYMSADQIVQTYSPEGLPEVKRFKQTMIKPGMRVRVQMGTGLSRSRAARTDQLMTYWQNGILRDPDQMAELLDVPVSAMNPNNAYDIKLARNENLKIAEGVPTTANSWDNHDIHRREHNNYRKSQDYFELPDKVKAMFEAHVEMHDQLQVQVMGQQLQRMEMAMQIAQAQQQTNPQPADSPPPGPQSDASAQDATASDLSGNGT